MMKYLRRTKLGKVIKWLHLDVRADIALSRDEASRFLPWIIALMVYLAALVLAGSFTLSHTIAATDNAQVWSFSVNLPHIADKDHDPSAKVLALIRETGGVKSADILSTARMQKMVEPWFGKTDALGNLPLPTVIEAQLTPGVTLDYEALRARITALAPGATLDDHKKWMAQFSSFIGAVQTTLTIIAILIISTTASVVIFACKTSLKIHRGTVNLLHRLGAVDGYIASQFQNHAALLTLKGAFIGSGFAAITLLVLHFMAHHLDSPLFPSFSLSLFHWFILFALPLFMSMLALAAARMSVLRSLSRAP
ncbi:MAG TPA: hypothetical protein VFT64_03490 [Rickettsiales bacterium]|nr:hypothetical protein [Rickettsiales bacterium]